MAFPNSQSKITLQKMLDKVRPFGDITPVLASVGGYQLEPFLTICTDVYSMIVGVPFPHKWNEINLPLFYTNSFQQDYALINPDGTSFYNVEWLERGIAIEMTSTQLPKPYGIVECGRQLPQQLAVWNQQSSWYGNPTFVVNTFPNITLYYGTWGAGNLGSPSQGNNPGPGSIYTSPLTSNTQAANPISQIQDSNGNLQLVTTYGTCGLTQPVWPASGAAPGTTTQDGTTVWTVVDPYGVGIRITPVPSQTGVVFQFNLTGQMPAITFTNLGQTFAPFPDKYEPYFRAGVIAQCYRYAVDPKVQAKFEKNYQIWLKSLNDLRAMEDRELEENRFVPEQSVFSRGGASGGGFIGPDWPFNYPTSY